MAEKRRSLLVDERLGETEWGRMIRSQVTVNQYDQGESIRYEKETFTRWINARLAAAPPPLRNDVVVGDLFLDLRDGLVLYYLVALLSNRASAAVGRPQVGLGSIIAMHNVGLVQKYLMRFLTNERQQLPDASHVVEGKPIAVLSLIWWIISHHTADGFDGDPQAVRCAILGWATRRCARAGLVPEALEQPGGAAATGSKAKRKGPAGYFSLSEDRVRDGRVFLALLHATDPNRFPYDPTDDVRRNISKAFERARSAYQVPVLLDAADEGCMKQEPLVLTYLSELRAALPARCAAPKRAGTVNAPPTWPPRRLGALARHVADPWAEECLRERGGWVGDVERMYPYRPTRHVFVAAAAALLKDALAFEEKLGDERDPRTMRRRQAFLQLIKQVAEPGNLRRMWTAREDGSLERLQAALRDAGVADDRDREALARLLLDPNLLGDAPDAASPLSPRALASSLFGSPGGGGGDTAAADVAARISLPLARRGLGKYARLVAGRARELWSAREAGGVAGVEKELEEDPAFGLSEASERGVLASMLLNPTALPFRSDLQAELRAAGLGDFCGLAAKHELQLCAARDYGGASAVAAAATRYAARDPLDREACGDDARLARFAAPAGPSMLDRNLLSLNSIPDRPFFSMARALRALCSTLNLATGRRSVS